jgi:predicted nucleotide-binding protein (sugar kinase/HSP70/actin superfamily)
MRVNSEQNLLAGRTIYVPQMCSGTARIFCGAMRSLGVDARPSPSSDARTRELAARHCTGDECYPHMVTLGDFLKLTEEPGFEPKKTAFFLPKTSGPCRFGQYSQLISKVLSAAGLDDVQIISPSCENGYRDLGKDGPEMMHYVWWAVVAGDLLRKILLRTRPYECRKGEADAAYEQCINDATDALARSEHRGKAKFADLKECLLRCRERFEKVEADYRSDRLLIGVAGEIFCRLNTFSNDDLVRKIEDHGGEAWVTDMGEWVYYSNYWEMEEIRSFETPRSMRMLGLWLSDRIQHRNEHELTALFSEALIGGEEPSQVKELVNRGARYIDPHAAMGEMILNLGKASWLQQKGADGMVDICPFSCMNGIICESIYPQVSRDLDGMPIRNFYFDGTQTNLDEGVGIFMELAAHYSRNKKHQRRVPTYFDLPDKGTNVA